MKTTITVVHALVMFITIPLHAQLIRPITPVKNLINELTTQPQFPGGLEAMDKFFCDSLQYPQMERDNDIQGKVMVRFMVDENGDIKFPEILRGVSPGLNKEALRVVKLLPKWKPATYQGKPVRVFYDIPVTFALN